MKKVKMYLKTLTSYGVALIVLISLMAFPDNIYGADSMKTIFSIKANNGRYLFNGKGNKAKEVKDKRKEDDWKDFKATNYDQCTLTATSNDGSVSFSWTKPSNSKNIIGYNLYRGESSGKQSSVPITDFPIEGTSYKDKNVESNSTYYYILKAVYKDNTLGPASNEVRVKTDSDKKEIVLEVGSRYMLVDGRRREIDPGERTTMVVKNGRVFLPIRALIEAMGGEVDIDSSDQRVRIYLNDDKIYLWIGEKTARVNGVSKESDVAPYISESGRTMLPLRFIVENLNCEADWDGVTKTVTIKVNN